MSNHSGFIKKILFVALVCLALIYILPSIKIANADSILTAATFLFSVLYGFEISVVISNFSQLKTQLAIENAGLLSIYHLGQIIGGDTADAITGAIDAYLLRAIDIPLENHLRGTNKEFFAIFDPLKTIKDADGQERGQAIQYLNEALYYIPQTRNQISEVAPKFVDAPVWTMLITLAVILVGVLFLSAGSGLLSTTAAALFSTTVIGSLFLLDELDSNRIQEAHLEYDIFNETLQSINALPYYPEFAIQKGTIKPPEGTSYRVGVFPGYPSLEERRIETRR